MERSGQPRPKISTGEYFYLIREVLKSGALSVSQIWENNRHQYSHYDDVHPKLIESQLVQYSPFFTNNQDSTFRLVKFKNAKTEPCPPLFIMIYDALTVPLMVEGIREAIDKRYRESQCYAPNNVLRKMILRRDHVFQEKAKKSPPKYFVQGLTRAKYKAIEPKPMKSTLPDKPNENISKKPFYTGSGPQRSPLRLATVDGTDRQLNALCGIAAYGLTDNGC